ncbi:DNA/RNA non-specific endonuclease [Lutibacter sp. HS1-25]|uniref:DNA/RNA non-specific endonuclease n=1 Tax=Lutibacter sp. HS1-25 TaxID=2485000 RepID=UPI0010122F46|nr:DNA/RNA non-specific endonuclease [Lutibacter sp. HS1-25]RXP60886.1 DNA/RNA non-specific endonuclease [Lutibacter sp. HS1-25]
MFKIVIINLFFIFLFVSCTSKSKQAKLRIDNSLSITKVRGAQNIIEASLKLNEFFFYPTSTTNQIIKHPYFTVSYSEKNEQAEWVAYKITSNNYNKSIERTNDYREDPYVKTQSASPKDYSGSGYDMGHLAPAHDMGHNITAMSESFYLSNISPQKASFNRGIWKSLEGKISYWSSFNDSIYVVTGPILDNPIEHIGENKVTVPRAFYKTLLAFKNGKIKAVAFIMPNEKSDKSIYTYAVPIDKVEEVTGIDFYYNLDKIIQDSLEANINLKTWISIR